jgi:hypothetical protein
MLRGIRVRRVRALVSGWKTQKRMAVSAAVEGGKERIEDVRQWFKESVTSFFEGRAEATFMFRGPIWYLRPSV